MKPEGLHKEFFVIGENIHTTRVVLRQGKLVTSLPSGEEAVRYTTTAGETRHLVIPDEIKARQDYQEGRVKHIMIAVKAAMSGQEPQAAQGISYLRTLVEKRGLRGQLMTGSLLTGARYVARLGGHADTSRRPMSPPLRARNRLSPPE